MLKAIYPGEYETREEMMAAVWGEIAARLCRRG